jgi:hypothetical protein
MQVKLILPKVRPDLSTHTSKPVYFLAGPILGAEDWQAKAFHFLNDGSGYAFVVNPRRYDEDDPLRLYEMEGEKDTFPHQTAWEGHYLELAGETAEHGCVIFWLSCESKTRPRADGQPYAMDTRGELGEWRWRKKSNPALRMVMGAEQDFPGLRTIRRNTDRVLGPDFPIYTTLEETLAAARTLALQR